MTGMSDKRNDRASATSTEGDSAPKAERARVDWSDPTIPVGNAPRLPRWPLFAVSAVWLAWVVFLFAMMLSRWGASPL